MDLISISAHPNLVGIERKVEVSDVHISYVARVATLVLIVNHYKDGKIWDDLISNGKSAISLNSGWVTNDGMPCEQTKDGAILEFDFLFSLLNGEGENRRLFDELIIGIVMRNDKMGYFNDYK